MTPPRNLSEKAVLDLDAILEESLDQFGEMQAQATQARIYERCQAILDRHSLGHRIGHLRTKRPILYHYERPWMIAFDPTTCEIIRIIHGRRDLAKLLR